MGRRVGVGVSFVFVFSVGCGFGGKSQRRGVEVRGRVAVGGGVAVLIPPPLPHPWVQLDLCLMLFDRTSVCTVGSSCFVCVGDSNRPVCTVFAAPPPPNERLSTALPVFLLVRRLIQRLFHCCFPPVFMLSHLTLCGWGESDVASPTMA